jgi:MFS family permease
MIQSYIRSFRLFSRDVRLYLGTISILGLTATSGVLGVLLGLYLLRLGYGPAFIGLVNAIGPFVSAASCLPAAGIGQRWGYRRTILIGLLFLVLGYGLLPLVEWIPLALQKGWILASYLVSGIGGALYIVNITPALTAATTSRDRNHVFALRIALMPLAGFAGSLIGGLLPTLFTHALALPPDGPASYRYAWWTGVLLSVPALWTAWAVQRDTPPGAPARRSQDAPWPSVFRRDLTSAAPLGLIILLATVGFLRVAGEGPTRAFFNVYLDAVLHLPTAQIGALMAIGRVLAIPAALVAPMLMERWGNGRTIMWGALGVTAGLLPLALIEHWLAAAFGFMAMTGLASISRIAFMVFTQEVVAERWRSAMSAATTLSANLSWGLMALSGGYLVELVGYRGMFLTGAALTAAGATLFGWRVLIVGQDGEISNEE